MKAIAIAASLMLSACATCHDHPVMCGIGAAVIAGSIAISIDHSHGGDYRPRSTTQPAPCQANPDVCQ